MPYYRIYDNSPPPPPPSSETKSELSLAFDFGESAGAEVGDDPFILGRLANGADLPQVVDVGDGPGDATHLIGAGDPGPSSGAHGSADFDFA